MNTNTNTNYTYLASEYFNLDTNALDIFSDLTDGKLHYICYHITTNGKYPFVQIMLELTQNCFDLPFVTINKDFTSENIANMILRKIKAELKRLRCKTDLLTINEYKGIMNTNLESTNKNVYALIDVSSVDISCLKLSTSVTTWFALPTEIINKNSVFEIPVSNDILSFFTHIMPELGVIYNTSEKTPYLLPDVVYTSSSDLKETEFQALFGPSKIGNYFHFCTRISQSEHNNRYALFIENPVQKMELDQEQDQDQIDQCIILKNHMIVVTEYESFTPLSYHTI
jgi:hypothetical protein